jgi:hypothetical protein
MTDTIAGMDSRDLYGLPLDRFTPERNALAKRLRGEGQREEAARVASMRKPSVAAWAVNQLVRTQRRAVAELFDAGDQLRSAQTDLLAGSADAETLREAAERERLAVVQLVNMARGLLSSEGHELSPATIERVSETLQAAALDEDARRQVEDGCLHQELRHVGLGSGAMVARPKKQAARKPSRREPTAERKRAVQLEAAQKAESQARRDAERAARELEKAERSRERAAKALEEAEATLLAARRRAREAAKAHRLAQRAVERA